MSRLVLRHVRAFDPGAGLDLEDTTVVVEDDLLVDLAASRDTTGERVIEGQGRLLIPGLVDLRAHLGEPGFTRRESVATGVRAAAAGGFTTVLAMPTTQPTVDRPEVVELIQARARQAGPTRVLVAGALSVGRQGERLAEMGKLKAAGCVAFTDADRAVKDSQLLRYALETAGDLGLPVITHAEDESLSLGGVMHEGIMSNRLGVAGAPGAAEVVGVARDLALAELTGCRLHIGHVSTAAAVELIRQAKRRGIRVTAEVAPLHLLLTDEELSGYDPHAKVFPPLRPAPDVDAMIMALADGTVDCVASDHTPQTELEKKVELDQAAPGAIALETTLAVILGLVRDKRLTLHRAVAVLTRAPSQALGRKDLGRLRLGGPADVCLVDLERSWCFERAEVLSRSHNSPLLGRTFTGRAVLTVAQGQITHESL
ncbi:MAG: dihydroorotase [Myxococcales bacterium]|nr:dihydroorotase [Myxococcales bacterium]MCB9648002.1 dihydroorotase [Deltaproteobacteria bacterium]